MKRETVNIFGRAGTSDAEQIYASVSVSTKYLEELTTVVAILPSLHYLEEPFEIKKKYRDIIGLDEDMDGYKIWLTGGKDKETKDEYHALTFSDYYNDAMLRKLLKSIPTLKFVAQPFDEEVTELYF